MDVIFDILSRTGWIWTIAFMVFLLVHAVVKKRRATKKGFDAVTHE